MVLGVLVYPVGLPKRTALEISGVYFYMPGPLTVTQPNVLKN